MHYIWLLVLISGGLFASTAAGQNSVQEVYPAQVSIDHNDAVESFSGTYISTLSGSPLQDIWRKGERSSGHLAVVHLTGVENTAVLTQEGYGISGLIEIGGAFNEARLEQRGADLLSILNIRGNANQFDMTQLGRGLQNYFNIYGSRQDLDVMQTNRGMRLTQTGTGSVPFSIQQTGRPSPIIISNN